MKAQVYYYSRMAEKYACVIREGPCFKEWSDTLAAERQHYTSQQYGFFGVFI